MVQRCLTLPVTGMAQRNGEGAKLCCPATKAFTEEQGDFSLSCAVPKTNAVLLTGKKTGERREKKKKRLSIYIS